MKGDPRIPHIPLKNPAAGEYGLDSMQADASRLMSAAKRGDRAAFDELVLTLRGRAYTVAQSLVGSREDALELSQEAFLKTYRARDSFREGEPFLPWFHRILRNTCFSHLRKQKRLRQRSLSAGSSDDDAGEWEIADESAPPSEPLERAERAEAFWIAFKVLAARDREILSLRHFEELSYQDIADALGVPIGTVMSRLFHARRRLRDLLQGVLDEGPSPAEEHGAAAAGPRAPSGSHARNSKPKGGST